MNALTLLITLQSPAYLSTKGTGANHLDSLNFLPGRAVMGAVAWAYLDRAGTPDDPHFQPLFVRGDVSWGDFLPWPETLPPDGITAEQVHVAPRTAKVCKLHGDQHGIQDQLLQNDLRACRYPDCKMAVDSVVSSLFQPAAGRWRQAEIRRGVRTHLAISQRTGTARYGALFSREALLEGQTFVGEIRGASESMLQRVRQVLGDLQGSIYIGGGRSRGYGALSVQIFPSSPEAITAESLAKFSALARAPFDPPSDALVFALTATSCWILRRADGSYESRLTSKRLAKGLDLTPENLEIVKADCRTTLLAGFDGAAGLPLEARTGIVSGSTFLCEARQIGAIDLAARLNSLRESGIGAARVAGFGRVSINHSLHWRQDSHA